MWRAPDMKALRVIQQPHRAEHRVIIRQRLSHAHEHDIAHALRQHRVLNPHDLLDDLTRGQAAREAALAGGAKRAAIGTANLAGNADRRVIGVGNEDAFDGVPVGGAEAILARPIAGPPPLDQFQAARPRQLRQPLSHRPRQVRHLLKHRAPMQPREELAAAIGRLARGRGRTVRVPRATSRGGRLCVRECR